MKKILAINAGSSSLKFQLFEMPSNEVIVSGIVERIGLSNSIFKLKTKDKKVENILDINDHEVAVNMLLTQLLENKIVESLEEINGVGHRVVHGGELYSTSVLTTEEVKSNIKELSKLAPLHNPANLLGIEVFMERLPHATSVAIFDTAFHQTMEPEHFLYPIPYKFYRENKIRRYGFHGTSHYYVSRRVAELMNQPVDAINTITLHLGNGGSISAINKGKSVNTSMGFTPLDGIMMGTRSGEIDPAILPFIMNEYNYSSSEVLDILNKQSGLLGLSEISSDARDILEAIEQGNKQADLTIDIFANRIVETVGSYYMQLGDVQSLVFTGGIGENAGTIRQRILDKCAKVLGIVYDSELNLKTFSTETLISTPESKVQVWIVPTNEELVIANETMKFVE